MNAEIKTKEQVAAEEPKLSLGMQGMMKQIIKLLGLDPAKIETQIRDFAGIMLNIDGRLEELKQEISACRAENAELKKTVELISAQNAEIITLLKKEKTDAR